MPACGMVTGPATWTGVCPGGWGSARDMACCYAPENIFCTLKYFIVHTKNIYMLYLRTHLSQVELGEVCGLEGELHDVVVDVGLEVAAAAVAEQLPRAHVAQLAAQHQARLLARVERVVVHAAANQRRALVSRDQR